MAERRGLPPEESSSHAIFLGTSNTAGFRPRPGAVAAKRILYTSEASWNRLDMKYLGPPQSGSLANQVFSANQFGQYVRNRTSPTQPSSPEADDARAAMADAVAGWSALSDSQRANWSDYARDRETKGLRIGKGVLDGQQAFIQNWLTMVAAQLTPFSDPPELPRFEVGGVNWSWTVVNSDMTPSTIPPSTSMTPVLFHRLLGYASDAVGAGAMRPTSFPRPLLLQRWVLGFALGGMATAWYSRMPGPFPPYPTGKAVLFGAREMSNGVLGPMMYQRLIGP